MNHEANSDEKQPGTGAGEEGAAIIGGFAEREVAHNIDAVAEHAYWLKNFASRPYVDQGAPFADYGPAYDYGVASATEYGGRTFDEVESELSQSWEQVRGASSLAWQRARHAVRDAWERVHKLVYGDRLA